MVLPIIPVMRDEKIEGKIDLVMQRGKILVKDGEFLGERGDGKYLKRGKEQHRLKKIQKGQQNL